MSNMRQHPLIPLSQTSTDPLPAPARTVATVHVLQVKLHLCYYWSQKQLEPFRQIVVNELTYSMAQLASVSASLAFGLCNRSADTCACPSSS